MDRYRMYPHEKAHIMVKETTGEWVKWEDILKCCDKENHVSGHYTKEGNFIIPFNEKEITAQLHKGYIKFIYNKELKVE